MTNDEALTKFMSTNYGFIPVRDGLLTSVKVPFKAKNQDWCDAVGVLARPYTVESGKRYWVRKVGDELQVWEVEGMGENMTFIREAERGEAGHAKS